MSPSGIEPATLGFLAGHLVRLAIGEIDYLCFNLCSTVKCVIRVAFKTRDPGALYRAQEYHCNLALFFFLHD